MAESHVFQAKALERAISAIVAAGGSEPREAQLVSSNLLMANLSGHDSHGVGMIPRYIESLKEGGLQPNRHPQVKFDGGALLALDGQAGYGQVIGLEATDMAIARAKQHGVCVMALANAHHLCRIGQWAEQAVAQGLVSISFVNVISRPIVAPFGGSDARFGTNPCTIGIPLPGQPPMILDMATSAVAQGKIRVAYNKGEKVAPGLLIDDKGNPTVEPRYGVIEPFGALTTMGLHKGYGLAVACELLGGALSGGGTQHTGERSKKRVLNGMLSILIDPARLGTAEFFGREAGLFIDWLKQSRPAPGFDRVRIAGDPERETRVERGREGIAVDATTWRDILAAGEKVGLAAEQTERAARG
ncbi:MAG TPA: malate/lactate/ureidoglycolate dehydrogenase [Burkholderiales bacterium]|nr:malate/lactate/ureidoglycolate dehydrogenase [Burkholderiales bacterium]